MNTKYDIYFNRWYIIIFVQLFELFSKMKINLGQLYIKLNILYNIKLYVYYRSSI